MRNLGVLTIIALFSSFALAENQVLTGKIIGTSSNVSTAEIRSPFCPNKAEAYDCVGIELRNVTIVDAAGKQTVLQKLLIPQDSSSGLMDMGGSFGMTALGLAVFPRDKWADSYLGEYFESATFTEFNYVLVPEDQLLQSSSSSGKVGLLRATVVLKYTPQAIATMNDTFNKNHDKTAAPPKDGKETLKFGQYLDLANLKIKNEE